MSSTKNSIAERAHASPVGPPLRSAIGLLQTPLWKLRGSPAPAPPNRKRAVIVEYARRVRPSVFVETGTFRGDTVARVAPLVPRVISIELDRSLHEAALRRFRDRRNVELVLGDSAAVLPTLVRELHEPALFWLDGHFSGGPTAIGSDTTPIMAELESILGSDVPHVVLVDDARLFDGTEGYPTIAEVRSFVADRRPDLSWTVALDVIRIEPARTAR